MIVMTTALVVLLAFNFVALSWWLLRQAQNETRLDLGTIAEKMDREGCRVVGGEYALIEGGIGGGRSGCGCDPDGSLPDLVRNKLFPEGLPKGVL